MDEGPFRASRPVERRAAGQPAEAYQPEQQPVASQPTTHRSAPAHRASKEKKPRGKGFKWPLIIGIVIVLGVIGWLLWSGTRSAGVPIDNTKYQAVFFTNGQVYFGKLKTVNDDYFKLTNIYYLKTQATDTDTESNPQQSTTDSSNVQLIKLGDEIHGPQDEMIISKDQVMFYENLKNDGKVVQSIQQYEKNN